MDLRMSQPYSLPVFAAIGATGLAVAALSTGPVGLAGGLFLIGYAIGGRVMQEEEK